MIIWSVLSSLTAGAADPVRCDATLAVHSMLGYAGPLVGPLAIGWTLDVAGDMPPMAGRLALGTRRRVRSAGSPRSGPQSSRPTCEMEAFVSMNLA